MKRLMCTIIIITTLIGCGNSRIVNGKQRETIGLVNILVNDSSILEPKWPDVQYKMIMGNVIWGIILCETVVAPIYFFGFSMFEPIGTLKK